MGEVCVMGPNEPGAAWVVLAASLVVTTVGVLRWALDVRDRQRPRVGMGMVAVGVALGAMFAAVAVLFPSRLSVPGDVVCGQPVAIAAATPTEATP